MQIPSIRGEDIPDGNSRLKRRRESFEKHVNFSESKPKDRAADREISTDEKPPPSPRTPAKPITNLNLDLKKVEANLKFDCKRNVSNLKIIT
jgi:hypothetical protein